MPSSVLDYPFLYAHLTESTQLTTAKGTLHTVTINRGDAHAAGVITIYDSADGVDADNIIAILIMDTAVFVIPQTLIYDINYVNGLYLDFDEDFTTADITVSYR